MALSLGQLLAGAGQVSVGMRKAEEAGRVARENQLKIEEQNRFAAMKARIAQQQFPSLEPMAAAAPQMPQFQFQQMPQRQMPVPATSAPIVGGGAGRGVMIPPLAGQPQPIYPAVDVGVARAPVTPEVQRAQDRAALLRLPMAALDVVQAPAAVGLNVLGSTAAGLQNIGGRIVNAITGEEVLPTDVEYRKFPLTPFYDRYVRQPEAAVSAPVAPQPVVETRDVSPPRQSVSGVVTPAVPETVVAPAVQAQRDQEAARIRAQELGTVERADAELRSIEAELKRTKEATSKQILQQQRDMVKAARDVLAAAPAAAPAAVAAPTPAPAAVAPQATLAPVSQNVANAVLNSTAQLLQTNPAQLSQAMQDTQTYAAQQRELMTRQRNDAARLAQIYMQSGTAEGITQGRQLMSAVGQADLALQQFDKQMRESMIYMQGMQGLQEFAATNNPARLSGIWSYYSAAPVGVQPRSDGRFDLFFDGQLSEEGLSKAQIQERAQLGMFQSARDAVAKAAELRNTLALKQQFSESQIGAMKDIWVALINGQTKLAEKQADAMQGKLTVDTNAGGAWFQTPQGMVFLSPAGIEPVPGGGQRRIMNVTPIVIPGR